MHRKWWQGFSLMWIPACGEGDTYVVGIETQVRTSFVQRFQRYGSIGWSHNLDILWEFCQLHQLSVQTRNRISKNSKYNACCCCGSSFVRVIYHYHLVNLHRVVTFKEAQPGHRMKKHQHFVSLEARTVCTLSWTKSRGKTSKIKRKAGEYQDLRALMERGHVTARLRARLEDLES